MGEPLTPERETAVRRLYVGAKAENAPGKARAAQNIAITNDLLATLDAERARTSGRSFFYGVLAGLAIALIIQITIIVLN